MGRRPKIDIDEDGRATLRVAFKLYTWQLICAVAKELGVSQDVAVRILMRHIEALFELNQIDWLPPEWRMAHKERRNANAGLPPQLVGVDLTKLHRTNKTKSGYVGVYANGRGFRAAGRRGEYIGQYDTAEEAAWYRYLFYKKNKLPYGELELEIDAWRQRGERGTDAEIAATILSDAAEDGTLHHYVDNAPESNRGRMIGFDEDPGKALADLKKYDRERD